MCGVIGAALYGMGEERGKAALPCVYGLQGFSARRCADTDLERMCLPACSCRWSEPCLIGSATLVAKMRTIEVVHEVLPGLQLACTLFD